MLLRGPPAKAGGCWPGVAHLRDRRPVVAPSASRRDGDDNGGPSPAAAATRRRRRTREEDDDDDGEREAAPGTGSNNSSSSRISTRQFERPITRKDMQRRARLARENAMYGLPGARVEGADLVVDLGLAAAAAAGGGGGRAGAAAQTPREAAADAARTAGAALNARLRARAARLRTWREAAALVAESGPDMDYLTVAAVAVRVGELLAPPGVLLPLTSSFSSPPPPSPSSRRKAAKQGNQGSQTAQEDEEDDEEEERSASLARDRLLLGPLAALALERADWFQAPHFAAVAAALALAGFGCGGGGGAGGGGGGGGGGSGGGAGGNGIDQEQHQYQQQHPLAARFWREFARLARRKVRSMALPQLSALCAALASASAPGNGVRPPLHWCDLVSRAAARRLVGQRLIGRNLKSSGHLGAPDPRRPSAARLAGGARRAAAAQAGDLGALLWAFSRWGYAPAGQAWASDALIQVRVSAEAVREARLRNASRGVIGGGGGGRGGGGGGADADAGDGATAARSATTQALGWLSSVAVLEAAAGGSGKAFRRLAPRRSWLASAARALMLGTDGEGEGEAGAEEEAGGRRRSSRSARPLPAVVAADAPLSSRELVEAYASLALLGYAPPPLGSRGDARAALRRALAPALGVRGDDLRLLPALAGGADGEQEEEEEEDEEAQEEEDDNGVDEEQEDAWDEEEDEEEEHGDDGGGASRLVAAGRPASASGKDRGPVPPAPPASASTAQLVVSAAILRERPPQSPSSSDALAPDLLARLAWAEGVLGRGGRAAVAPAAGDASAAAAADNGSDDGWMRLSGRAAAAEAEAAWLDALAARLERAAPRLSGPSPIADALWGLAACCPRAPGEEGGALAPPRSFSRALDALGRRLAEELERPDAARVSAAVVGRAAAAVVCLSGGGGVGGGGNGGGDQGDNVAVRLAALLSAPLQRRLGLLLQDDPASVGAAEIADVLGVAAMAAIGATAGAQAASSSRGGGRRALPSPAVSVSPALLPPEPLMRAATVRLGQVAAASAAAADFSGGRAARARRRALDADDEEEENEGEDGGGGESSGALPSASSAPAPEDLAPHLVGALWACAALRYKPEPRLLHDVLTALGSGGGGGGGGRGGRASSSASSSSAAPRALRRLSGRELSDLGWALACLRHRPGAAWLAAYAEEARARAPYLPGRPLSDALWALAAFGARPSRDWLACAGAAVAARLSDGGLGAHDAAVALWALEALGCADVSEVLLLEEGGEGGEGATLESAKGLLVGALGGAGAR